MGSVRRDSSGRRSHPRAVTWSSDLTNNDTLRPRASQQLSPPIYRATAWRGVSIFSPPALPTSTRDARG